MKPPAIVSWAPRARRRLRDILLDIRDAAGPVVAAKWGHRLLSAPDAIAAHPRLGRMVPELGRPDIRELVVPPYRILYRLRPGACEVLTLRHSRQLLPPDDFTP